MLTEDQILDEQVQTLDCALGKLEEHSDEPIAPNEVGDTDVGHTLSVTVECLKATVDLYHTISIEGVSADDIKALRNIRNRMAPYMSLPTKVALEEYEGMFTPNRTMINQVVSQEATLAEIGTTLKEWFFKFVDFVIKVVDWCRLVWNSESIIRLRLRAIDSNIQSMYNAMDDAFKRNAANGRDLSPELNKIASLVLSDPKLTRSPSMIISFGESKFSSDFLNGSDIRNSDSKIDRTFSLLMKSIVSLKGHVEDNKPIAVPYDFSNEINWEADLLDDLFVASEDKDFFLENLGLDFWKNPKRLTIRPLFYPSHNIEQVQRLSKEFRSIKRNVNFEKLNDVDTLVKTVEGITGSVKGLERMITIKQKLLNDYYKASATYANFYIRARELLIEELVKNSTDDNTAAVIAKLNKVWEELLKKMGV